MKPTFLVAWLTGLAPGYALAQIVLYEQTFESANAPALPADWFTTAPAAVYTEAPVGSPSGGYAGASGGNCLVALNCNPNGETRVFQVDHVATTGAAGLVVSFGHRRTSTFTPAVTLQWSANGTQWHPLNYNSAAAGSSWTHYTSTALPTAAQNQPSLSFRWLYTTQVTNTACQSFAGNYRIDDFRVTAVSLPVELEVFAAELDPGDGTVTLYWRTATESAHQYCAVERSSDGRTFAEMVRVAGAGTSAVSQEYFFEDSSPPAGRCYYRLRFVDLDGGFTFSPVRTVDHAGAEDFRVYPSPADAVLFVRAPSWPFPARTDWQIFDEGGGAVLAGAVTAGPEGPWRLDVGQLRAGLYALRLVRERETWWKMFVKQ